MAVDRVVGEYGQPFIVDMNGRDLTNSTAVLCYRSPSGVEGDWPMSIDEAKSWVKRVWANGDIDEDGDWEVQVVAAKNDGSAKHKSQVMTMVVAPSLC